MSQDQATPQQTGISEPALRALVQASAAINKPLKLAATLKAIATSAAELLDAEASSVLLLDPVRNKLRFEAATGECAQDIVGQEIDAGLGIAGSVVTSGEAMLVPDVREHPAFFRAIDQRTDFTTREIIAAPMVYDGETIGVVEVLNRRPPRVFSPPDLEMLKVFANLAAISTNHAQVHDTLKRENRGLREAAQRSDPIIGESDALLEVMKLVERVAPTDATVLLLGETGTGKELTARAVHDRSKRALRQFIAINCAALPETLLESELFGHEEGAFTGAQRRKIGRFELADGGTLFLDEIGDLSASTQIKLLRVLQEREFVRVGGTETIRCDVRIIAATNRDLAKAMEDGTFREDLYYRLNVFPILLPPLRKRPSDVAGLVRHYIQLNAREAGREPLAIAPDALKVLQEYDWPGNIRELRNVIERAVLLCDGDQIQPRHLPPELVDDETENGADEPPSSLEEHEKAMILNALHEHEWNQTAAARALGIPRDNLRYRIRKYEIQKPDE